MSVGRAAGARARPAAETDGSGRPEPAPRGEAGRPSPPAGSVALRTIIQILLAAGALVAAIWVLHRLQGVILLLVLSVLFAYLVAPIVAFFRRPISLRGRKRALPSPLAIAAAYLVIFGTAAGATMLLLPTFNEQIAELRGELPGYVARVEASWQAWQKGQTRALPRDLRVAVDGLVSDAVGGGLHSLRTEILPMLGSWLLHLPWLVLVPILAFFLLKDADRLRKAALALFPGRRLRWRGDVFFEDVNHTLAAYIRSQLLASLVVAVLCSVGFLLLGVPYAVVLGLLAGVAELLPLVGPFLVAVLAVALEAFDSPSRALGVAAFLLVVRVAQDYVIYPKLVGREMPLHPMAVILAILCGGELAGVAGIFLAVPVLAVLTVAFHHWRAHRDGAPAESAV